MKKIALLFLASLSFSFAQAQGAQFGLKAGVNLSNISGDLQDEDIYQNKLGFVGGITTNFPLSSDGFLNLAPELLYSSKGYQYRDDEITVGGVTTKYKGDVSFNYIDLPVMFKINAGGLFFEGGPLASYLLDIKDKTERKVGNDDFEDVRIISKGDASSFEVGYAAGLGYKAPMGISLNLRYNGSINALADEDDGGRLTNGRHSVFQFTLGYLLGGAAAQ
jgi:Outer membrane protein beta-barrel domain